VSEQLTLDLGMMASGDMPLTMITVCSGCGAEARVQVQAGETWQPAMLWGYVALKAHEAEGCPGR
jgi:hypothetical protein